MNKYEVPALRRAEDILHRIASSSQRLKLMELSQQLAIHKSSMFSLLKTMEQMNWIVREQDDTYALGSALGWYGHVFFRQYDIIATFQREATYTMHQLQESIQLAKLEGKDTFYLAKVEALSPVKLISEPGMKFPAHATALGKALLAEEPLDSLQALFTDEYLQAITMHTITSRQQLFEHLAIVRQQGFAFDLQEAVMGFQCIAMVIRDVNGVAIGAVSCSMPIHQWEDKKDQAIVEIKQLVDRLSLSTRN